METSRILAEIDSQIAKLQQARALLAGVDEDLVPTRGRGRPKGSSKAAAAAPAAPAEKGTRRKLTPEGRQRIAEAMKRRWAERKKTPAKQ